MIPEEGLTQEWEPTKRCRIRREKESALLNNEAVEEERKDLWKYMGFVGTARCYEWMSCFQSYHNCVLDSGFLSDSQAESMHYNDINEVFKFLSLNPFRANSRRRRPAIMEPISPLDIQLPPGVQAEMQPIINLIESSVSREGDTNSENGPSRDEPHIQLGDQDRRLPMENLENILGELMPAEEEIPQERLEQLLSNANISLEEFRGYEVGMQNMIVQNFRVSLRNNPERAENVEDQSMDVESGNWSLAGEDSEEEDPIDLEEDSSVENEDSSQS